MDRQRQKRVLIAGGGVAALEAALALRRLAEDKVRVELLAPELHFWYRPLAVAAPFELGDVLHFELDGLARKIGVEFTLGGLVGIDAWRHVAHTSRNTQLEYDMLLVACGALPMPAIPGALTFRGPADIELIGSLLRDLESGAARSVAFVIPWGAVYSLPAYELALLTSAHLDRQGVRGVEVRLVTPEDEPLQVFGPEASEAIRELFSDRGIALRTGAYPRDVVDGMLRLLPDGSVEADRVVALARLKGAPLDGIPQTVDGFVPVDAHGRVHRVADVYAAGDITSFTVKQGGIAAQQADTVAEAIAAAAGADVEPTRFRPVLRGVLLTGTRPRYLRRDLGFEPEVEPVASLEALWWPPAKIVGRYLAPFLASIAGVETPSAVPADEVGVVEVERVLDSDAIAGLDSSRLLLRDASDDEPRADAVMTHTVVMVAPEDTLGEAAERLLGHDVRAAVVAEYGRIVGILTSSDLLRASAARAHPAEARVREWMTAEPLTVAGDTPVSAVRVLMEQYGVDDVPVAEAGSVAGIVDRDQVDRVLVLSPGLGF
jgi:sulfide:quinone oxidoreductase